MSDESEISEEIFAEAIATKRIAAWKARHGADGGQTKEINSASGRWAFFGGNQRFAYDRLSLSELIWANHDFMANGDCRVSDSLSGSTYTLPWYCEYYASSDEVIWGAGGLFVRFENVDTAGQLLLRVSVPSATASLRVLKRTRVDGSRLQINVGGHIAIS